VEARRRLILSRAHVGRDVLAEVRRRMRVGVGRRRRGGFVGVGMLASVRRVGMGASVGAMRSSLADVNTDCEVAR